MLVESLDIPKSLFDWSAGFSESMSFGVLAVGKLLSEVAGRISMLALRTVGVDAGVGV